jgi:predicted RNA-binding protein
MNYYLNLFSPETYEAFNRSGRTVSGFRTRQRRAAERIQPGDRFVCYMTKLSRWVGVLEVEEGPYEDDTPIFYEEDDPFVVRFRVRPVAWLPLEKTVPIYDDRVWNALTFTRDHDRGTSTWTGRIRASLAPMDREDGAFLESLILEQASNGQVFDVDDKEYRKHLAHRVRRADGVVSVSVPEEEKDAPEPAAAEGEAEVRESIRIQSLIATIGSKMGMKVWVPRGDRARVEAALEGDDVVLLDSLPLNYDETTIRTIEQIDVLWLKGRAIQRAFEVEHTTSIHSGILRMADLLALQPNMDIRRQAARASRTRRCGSWRGRSCWRTCRTACWRRWRRRRSRGIRTCVPSGHGLPRHSTPPFCVTRVCPRACRAERCREYRSKNC